jgi:rare lipoprotein A
MRIRKLAALGVLSGLLWSSGCLEAHAKTRSETVRHSQTHGRQHASKASPGKTSSARGRHPTVVAVGHAQEGKASIYAESLRGRKMADGTPFNPASDTAASKTLPLGTTARVTNLKNGRTATVRVGDRGPYKAGRIIDVSPGTAGALGMKNDGVAPVAVVPLAPPQSGNAE